MPANPNPTLSPQKHNRKNRNLSLVCCYDIMKYLQTLNMSLAKNHYVRIHGSFKKGWKKRKR